ncbi:MAG: TldD/PmbA family protein [Firmicutes bacterium]|nr:TldD/PmbA family protein [Bacillota bacterium]
MLNPSVALEVLFAALAEGGDFAEIFLEDRLNNALVMRGDTVETVSTGRTHGAGIRIFHRLRCIYAYTNDTSVQGLRDCAAQAAAAVRSAPRNLNIVLTERHIDNIHGIGQYPGDTAHKARLRLMANVTRAARAVSPEIIQAQCRYADSDQRVWIANSEGVFAHDRRVYTRIAALAVASNGKENQVGFEGPGAMRGIELFDTVDPETMGKQAATRAVTMLHAPVCPAGIMPVAIASAFGGVVFHEACGHSLEAASVARGQSEFAGKIGQKIAAECVTAIDDGTEPNSWGSLNVDDEGMPTRRNVLIENGILKGYLIDKLNGLRMGMPSTGSGRRESYQYAPTSRMTNTYIAPGRDDDEQIIASMGEGLYAASMGGGSVDPATGMFNFAVDEGYLVKNGKVDTPVRGASLIGRGSEVLMKIDRVGKGLACGQGMCGAMSGSVPTNVGQPMIRISRLTVGGR